MALGARPRRARGAYRTALCFQFVSLPLGWACGRVRRGGSTDAAFLYIFLLFCFVFGLPPTLTRKRVVVLRQRTPRQLPKPKTIKLASAQDRSPKCRGLPPPALGGVTAGNGGEHASPERGGRFLRNPPSPRAARGRQPIDTPPANKLKGGALRVAGCCGGGGDLASV